MVVNKFEPLPDSDSEENNPLVPNVSGWIQFIMGAPANFEVSSDTPSTETDSDGPPSLEEIPFYEVCC